MSRFDVFNLPDSSYVVDVQSDVASVHRTLLVIPLIVPEGDMIARLYPAFDFAGESRILATQSTAAIDSRLLLTSEGSLAHEDLAINGALDFLINGF